MNPSDSMVVLLKDILLWLLGFRFIYIVCIIYDMFQILYYHQHASLMVCLSLLSACISQNSMDDLGHTGNTGQLLNSRVLDVL